MYWPQLEAAIESLLMLPERLVAQLRLRWTWLDMAKLWNGGHDAPPNGDTEFIRGGWGIAKPLRGGTVEVIMET